MNSNLSQNRYRPMLGHLINLDGGGGVVGIYAGYRPKHSNLVYIVKVKSRIRNCSCKTFPKNEIEIIAIAEVKNGPKSVRKVLEMPKSGWSWIQYYPILTRDNIINLSQENISDPIGNLIFIPYSKKEWEKDHPEEKTERSDSKIPSIW